MRDVSRDVWSRDSCQRGWRLLYILTAFHRCSEVLKPFLFKYLQHAYLSAGVLFQGAPLTLIQLSKHAFFFCATFISFQLHGGISSMLWSKRFNCLYPWTSQHQPVPNGWTHIFCPACYLLLPHTQSLTISTISVRLKPRLVPYESVMC